MLTVWGRRSSFNLQKVMWLVGELGIEHRHIEAGGRFGGLDRGSSGHAVSPSIAVTLLQNIVRPVSGP
jgi:hypothetical protein